jgi:hypothetical protein
MRHQKGKSAPNQLRMTHPPYPKSLLKTAATGFPGVSSLRTDAASRDALTAHVLQGTDDDAFLFGRRIAACQLFLDKAQRAH